MEEAAAEPTPTVVQHSFGGKTLTVSRCAECGTKSEKVDDFRDLQLSFPQNANNPSVQSLMEFFLESEKLYGDNQYRCDTCDKLTGKYIPLLGIIFIYSQYKPSIFIILDGVLDFIYLILQYIELQNRLSLPKINGKCLLYGNRMKQLY